MQIMIACGNVAPYFSKRYKLIRQMMSRDCQITLGGSERGFEERIASEHMEFIYLPCERSGLNPLHDLQMLFHYYRNLKGRGYSAFHSYTAKPNIYGSIAARFAGIDNIYPVVNGLGFAYTEGGKKERIVQIVMNRLYRIAFHCASKVFFQNADDARELVERGVLPESKVVVISGSGIDLEAFPFAPIPDAPVFLMASRLLISKGTRTYLEAAKMVKERYPNVRIQLAGTLDDNPNSISKAELDLYQKMGIVEYLGYVSDMPAVLKQCTTFVLPSYYREGVPHAVLEAMSIGRAVITTDAPGCRETVNGSNGFLIPPKDANALAEKMIWCIEHPDEVSRMGEQSRAYAESRFDVNLVNEDILTAMGLTEN